MSTRLDILADVIAAVETQGRSIDTLGKWNEGQGEQINRLWEDNAALRDELHALANRIENLTRALNAKDGHS